MGDGRLGRASLVRGALPVTPGRESLRLSDRAVRTGSLPQSRSNTSFVSRQQAARVDRVPFEDQRRGIDQMTRSTFSGQRSSAGNSSAPAANRNVNGIGERRQGSGNAPAGNSAVAGNSGWRRFSEPAGGSGQNAVRTPQSQSSGSSLRTPQSSHSNSQGGGVSRNSTDGWSRFGTGSGTTSRNLGSGNSTPRATDGGQNYRSNGSSVAPRSASPRSDSPRTSSPQVYRGGGQTQVRVNPPIVRQRAPSSNGGGGSYTRSAPGGGGNYSRPAPSGGSSNYSRSAPSSGGGGSFTRSAPSGGGGSSTRSAPSSGGGSRNSSGGGGSRNSGRTR